MPLRKSKPSEVLAHRTPGIVFADLSNNNGKGAYHAGTYCSTHPFLIHKASQGTHFVDEFHAPRCEETHKHGRAVGHYHFIDPGSNPLQAVEEAQHFVNVVRAHTLHRWPNKPLGFKADFFVIDFEVGASQPQQIINNFCRVVSRHFPTISIIGYSGYFQIRELRLQIPGRKWWVAAYPGPIRSLPEGQVIWAHQYTDKGRVQGIAGPCDKSIIVDKNARGYWTSKL